MKTTLLAVFILLSISAPAVLALQDGAPGVPGLSNGASAAAGLSNGASAAAGMPVGVPALPGFPAAVSAVAGLPAGAAAGPLRLQHPVSSSNAEARGLFEQGLFFVYAFNHEEAVRSFQEAARLDPEFAMAHWGVALALGPNINLESDPPRQRAAFEEITRARALSAKASEPEKAYIEALATRYTGDPDEDQHKLAVAYMAAMQRLHQRYPDDPDAATLYAESLMDLRPWQLWSADGRPAPGTLELVAVLESVLRRYPSHIGANHYYIHAVEASPHPEWALPSAQRLEAMQLDAGHLVHMPSHIYLRIGDYALAAQCNEAAAAADQRYLESAGSGGLYPMMYYSHNLHFLAVARSMQGDFKKALAAADKLWEHVAPSAEAMPMLEFFVPTPELVLVRFHKWQEILKGAASLPHLPLADALHHFARGMAYAATGELVRARAESAQFREAAAKVPAGASFDLNRASAVLPIAGLYLEARIARGAGDLAGAADLLRKGVAAEDALRYTEPPSWYLPLREPLGGVLLAQGNWLGAELVFREELARNPRSGRALFGLWESLKGQDRQYEAQLVRREFEAAWRDADGGLDRESL
jgi:tetratricopeptide (TPR) repeat protein